MFSLKNIPNSVVYTADEIKLADLLNSKNFDTWSCKCPKKLFPRGTSKKRKDLKDKLKRELKTLQKNHCAYCGINFFLITNSKIHRDHILPKNTPIYRKFTFESKNIVLACDVCNGLDMKKDKDYVTFYSDDYNLIQTSIVHPHLDNIEEHINLDNSILAEVINNSPKGRTTIIEFQLNSERNVLLRGAFMQRETMSAADNALFNGIINRVRTI